MYTEKYVSDFTRHALHPGFSQISRRCESKSLFGYNHLEDHHFHLTKEIIYLAIG
jgi:hypothetical protein